MTEQRAVWLPHIYLYRPCFKHVLKRFLFEGDARLNQRGNFTVFLVLGESSVQTTWINDCIFTAQFSSITILQLFRDSTFVKNYVFW
jgi:hypothetical protein